MRGFAGFLWLRIPGMCGAVHPEDKNPELVEGLLRPTTIPEYESLDVRFRELDWRWRRAAAALGHDELD